MKTIIALFIASLVGCGNEGKDLDNARDVIKAECGEAPLAPGWAVAFDTTPDGYERASMSKADFANIQQWREDVEAYTACVQGFSVNQ